MPIYRGNGTSVATRASISTSCTVTNVGSVAATNPTGTLDLQFIGYGTDVAVSGSKARTFVATSVTLRVTLTSLPPLSYDGAGNRYAHTYPGALAPG